jgi:hypothetical protein
MDRTSTRRPRRLRALLVAAALGTSLFATALPAAAAPSGPALDRAPAFLVDGEFIPSSWIWTRSVDGDSRTDSWIWTRSVDGEFTTQSWIWTK